MDEVGYFQRVMNKVDILSDEEFMRMIMQIQEKSEIEIAMQEIEDMAYHPSLKKDITADSMCVILKALQEKTEGNTGTNCGCDALEEEHPDKAIEIVKKWGEEHPVKTLLDKFFEVFPNASKDKRGTPLVIFPRQFGYKDDGCCVSNEGCLECWSQAYVEVEK